MQPGRHCYAGGNTNAGFIGYFHEVLPPHLARRLVVLKGGSGVGKSSFMRKLALQLEALDFAVEYLHCSSDPDSLDGILCPGLGFAALDGTAPHIVDPVVPGAVDGIVNLGVFLNEEALSPLADTLRALMCEKSGCFRRAYCYLKAAEPLYADAAAVLSSVTDMAITERILAPWLDTLCAHRSAGSIGHERHLFAEAITPKGIVSYLDTMALPRLWRITGPWGSDVHALLIRLRDMALLHGLDVESVMDPCLHGRIRHLMVPALGLFITSEEDVRALPHPAERSLDLRVAQPEAERFPQHVLRSLAFDRMTYEQLLAQAVDAIAQAKRVHVEIEKYYVANMNFEAAQAVYDQTLAQVLRLAKVDVGSL